MPRKVPCPHHFGLAASAGSAWDDVVSLAGRWQYNLGWVSPTWTDQHAGLTFSGGTPPVLIADGLQFSGTTTFNAGSNPVTSDLLAADQWTFWIRVRMDSDLGGNVIASGNWILSSNPVTRFQIKHFGTGNGLLKTISTGTFYVLTTWYDGANINFQVDEDSPTSVGETDISVMSGRVDMGTSSIAITVSSMAAAKASQTAAVRAAVRGLLV